MLQTQPPSATTPTPPPPAVLSRRARAVGSSRIRELLRLVDRPGVLSLAGGLPAPSSLDAERVRRAADGALAQVGPLGPSALQYGPTEGIDDLRALIAERHGVDRYQVVITTGSQQGIDLLARTLCDAGDVAVVEGPSYLGALQSLVAAEVRVHAVDGDADGLDVDRLADALRRGLAPRLVYVVPDFHNPTGAVLSLQRRRQLTELSHAHGFFVVEDDPYGELRFAGAATPSIAQSAPGTGHVVRLGSASKILAPGLRIGWMIGPPDVIDAVTRLKQAADLHTPSLTQLIVASLLRDEPRQERHLDEVRALYRERSCALDEALRTRLGDRLDLRPATGGMFAWATATDGTDTDELFERAIAHGVAFVPGSAFSTEEGRFRDAMRLSFATLDPGQLDLAVARLATAWPAPSTGAAR